MTKMLIAIQGFSNSGKTTTLKNIISLLLNNNSTKLIDVKNKTITSFNMPIFGDVSCIFEVTTKNATTLKIGIGTAGDDEDTVKENLTYFDNNKCDIILCATRSKGQTVDCIHTYIKNKNIIFLPIYKAPDKNHHDKKLAEDIIYTIWEIIS